MRKLSISVFIISIALLSACSSDVSSPVAVLGNPDAPILVEEFSDFECPACGQVGPELEEIISRNKDIARLEFHHFPLQYHQNAFKAAEASECANDQGKFWEYAKQLFKKQKSLSEDNLKTFAGDLGLNQETFDGCLDSGKKKSRIRSDMAEARRRQLSYTPSIYVNGELVKYPGAEQFEAYLKSL